ncbi:MAG: antibiotic biosynthesis monooxygenase [Nitrososphaerota archaeon]|nr:antibiotic biosynthesis monooxygenase [Nitrososphaerota archaeon]
MARRKPKDGPQTEESQPAIARIWHGVTPKSKRDEFIHYVGATGMKEIKSSKGNRGAYLFTRDVGDNTEFVVISLWDSEDAIQEFTGADIKKAKYYRRDSEFLAELEPGVAHFHVASKV